MSKWPKIFLVLSVIILGFGLTSAGGSVAYGALKPAGVILFMLFYIVHLFEKEMAQYDEETRSKTTQRKGSGLASNPKTNDGPSGQTHGGAALVPGRSY
jgi:hypothetical protein